MPGAHAQYIGCAQDRRDIDMRACSASPGALPFSALAQRVAWGRAYGAPYMATTLGYTLGSVWSVGCHESVCGVCDTTRSDLHFLYPRDRDRSLARFQLHHLRRRTGTHIRAPRARAPGRSDSPRRESRAPGPAQAEPGQSGAARHCPETGRVTCSGSGSRTLERWQEHEKKSPGAVSIK